MNAGEFHLMRDSRFTIRKGGIFCSGKEIDGLCGGVHDHDPAAGAGL
ncbi:MAG: hypothetical protein ACLQVJ_08120 [Syntrophobacteraceae bacterium]